MRWSLLFLIVLIFTIALYPELVVQKQRYQIGDVAKKDVKASEDFFIEDKDATQNHRDQAINDVRAVYDFNPRILKNTTHRLNDAFALVRTQYEQELEKSANQMEIQPNSLPDEEGKPDLENFQSVSLEKRMLEKKNLFEERIGLSISEGAFLILMKNEFTTEIPRLITNIISQLLTTGVVANKEILLKEVDKGITLRNVVTLTEAHVLSLKQFYGPDQAKAMVRVIGDPLLKGMDYALLNLIVDLSQRLLRPNITLNSHETEARRKIADESVKPVLYMIKKGEMLLREGERVTPLQLRKIDAMVDQAQTHRVPLASSAAAALLTIILVIQYRVRLVDKMKGSNFANKDLLFFSCIMVAFIVLVKFSTTVPDGWFFGRPPSLPTGFGIPLAAGAMVVCLFKGQEIALIFSLALAVCATMVLQGGLETFIYFIISCTMASWWLQDCRERKIIIKTGAKIGLLNTLLATVINIYLGNASWGTLPFDLVVPFIGGVVAGIITVGIAPVIEILFRYTTDITLLELANLDQPILRKLMLEAPGTYHHSVVVGSLVEAAAADIGASPILAKVCGYYHDIGKLKNPLYFIENQLGGKNRHDKLAPSMSALILIAHVKNGVEIARKNKLGQTIIDTIQQHHGSSLISYFYEKAKTIKDEKSVNIDDFRYPGPLPQTKEAALVMLADVVEAASRTLSNPTPSRIQGMVHKLINKVFSDGQLDHCELTLKDLHHIAKSFNKILNGIHHHRIEYLENSNIVSGKTKNGSVDRKQTKSPQPADEKDREDGQTNIRRLGIS